MLTFSALDSGIRVTDGSASLVVFPRSASAGKDQVTLLSIPEEVPTEGVISWPGEYDTAGVTMRGIAHRDGQQVSFISVMDDTRLGFLSAPLQEWEQSQMETAGDLDVLVVPMTDAKLAQKLIEEFDPRVLILVPTGDAEASAALSKSLGATGESVSEYKLKSLPQEGREVVVLTA